MASWSAEKATEAYLQAIKMGKRGNEPSTMEFIAALAAGHNSKLMIMACTRSCRAAAMALVCASWQTGGHVVCILRSSSEVAASRIALGRYADSMEFVIGDARKLLSSVYKSADFVLMDFRLVGEQEKGMCVGYNATTLHSGGPGWWWWSGEGARFLPVGKGGWVYEIDESTREQHFYKISSSSIK